MERNRYSILMERGYIQRYRVLSAGEFIEFTSDSRKQCEIYATKQCGYPCYIKDMKTGLLLESYS